jgi:quinol-cytochrome oxidoreductase complex cytochrome b subunit
MRPSFFHHLHPPTIPAPQARLRYTLGAGGLSFFLLLVVIVSGALEMFFYVPTPDQAPLSIQTISYLIPFGGWVRNLHYWSAQLLVVVACLHLLRVVFTGAFAPPRRFNFLIGMGLLLVILFLDFTGYALRWDEGVRWALVAGTNLVRTIPLVGDWLYHLAVGAEEPGAATLVRFYAWHIFGLTLAIAILAGWHIFRVRRDGGIAVPPPELRADPSRISRFELARREGLAAILASAALIGLAAWVPAPIASPIQGETGLAADSLAPWFFLWVQQMLKWGDPFIFGVAIPAGIFVLLAVYPYLFKSPQPAELGRWFPPTGRRFQVVIALVAAGIITLTILALAGAS